MKQLSYTVGDQHRRNLMGRLEAELDKEPAITFAYLYGSVMDSDSVHDIDVGVYLRGSATAQGSTIVMELSTRLTEVMGLPVDVHVLNDAPLSFLFHVVRGHLLMCRDETLLTTMLEHVSHRYLDLAPLLRQSTKDAFAA